MKAVFYELPAFERHRDAYLDEEGYRALQNTMMETPLGGALIEGTGGLRKLRFPDARRNKGKRGGLRVIYYFWDGRNQFWLFTVYDKDESSDLTPVQRRLLKAMLARELESRQ